MSNGFTTRFYDRFPQELEDRNITETQFKHTIQGINSCFLDAEKLSLLTFVEGCLGCLSIFTLFLFYDSHYKKTMDRLDLFLLEQNASVYRKRGLEVINPLSNGLLELEIRIIEPQREEIV
eukprot:TRINITY_DN6974_c0_g1_i2.p1 TRINITY_DN6974_c0_g1~~TRINITY_DN6974_c0_g1_i2.p1  ORF type:complete len:121 (-),score=12.01 TRINITY_DN6974_c0_g1_i2:223-585(-)